MRLFGPKKKKVRPVPHRDNAPRKAKPNAPVQQTSHKPTPRRRVQRDKRMTYRIRCWLLVEENDNDTVIETNTVNMSKTGLLVRALNPLPIGQRVLILLIDKKSVSADEIRGSQFFMKGKIVRVEPQEMMCEMGIQITFGRPNPVAHEKSAGDTKYWWTRHWQE
ncbi:MAG: hypothetical protein DRI92_06600 [Aquificota bacterium]|nr:MAG: hypothetical protein DRI92_06600 [Aquificota bacterium]